MKFRPVREMLDDAMSNMVEIPATIEALCEQLNSYDATPENISLVHQGFDDRIGWDSYLVCINDMASGYIDQSLEGVRIE